MNDQPIIASQNKQPLLMTYQELKKTLVPFCKGKRPLIDMINDIWNISTPTPNFKDNQLVKIVFPKYFEQFVRLCLKENG